MTDDKVMTPGTVVGTRYEISKLIGQGGFSMTYLAIDKQLMDYPCVVKELLLSHHANELAVTLFKREAQVLLKLDHKHVPKVHACFEEHGRLFLVQDFVEGETLDSKLVRDGPLSEARVRDIVLQLLDVLEYLHGHEPRVIHRDIKPANLIAKPDGSIVLIDFGAVREALGGSDSAGQTQISSAGYSPHEQYIGHAGPASDIYALGATALHLVSGVHPRDWHDPATGRFSFGGKLPCSPKFAAVIERMVADLPQRFQSAQSVRAALQVDDSPTTTAAPSGGSTGLGAMRDKTTIASSREQTVVPPPPPRGFIEQHWPKLAGAAVVVLVLAAVLKPDAKPADPAAGATTSKTVENPRKQGRLTTPTSTRSASTTPTQGDPPQGSARQTSKGASPPARDEAPSGARQGANAPTNTSVSKTAAAPVETSKPAAPAAPPVVTSDACAGTPRCFNAGHFAATLGYVAVSKQDNPSGMVRNVKLTIKLRNLTDQPLILAYRGGSGQLVDDEKNRYGNESYGGESFVKGIGINTGRDANPEFVLDPHESRDVILDNSIRLGKTAIYGVTYSYDLTIDELVVQGNRARPTRSSAITFRDIKEPSRGGDEPEVASAAGIEAVDAAGGENEDLGLSGIPDDAATAQRVESRGALVAPPSPAQDACGTTPNCFSAGRFIATVTRVWSRHLTYQSPAVQLVKLTIRLRNVSDKQVVLAYKAASGELTDDTGRRFRNESYGGKEYVSGIAIGDNTTDPLLVLGPGEARDATFDNYLAMGKTDPVGTVFGYDQVLQELELLPNGQTRATRTDAVGFHDLRESPRSATKATDTTSYDAGRFVARIIEVSAADTLRPSRTERHVTLTVGIKNVTDQPMILAYRAQSQELSDDRAHSYASDRYGGATWVTGIGLNTRGSIDAAFTLAPGESREAAFTNLIFLPKDDRPGSVYDYDLVLDECERTPSRQLRVVRSYSVSFHDFQISPLGRKKALMDALKSVIKKP